MFITCELMTGPQRCKRHRLVHPKREKDNCQPRSVIHLSICILFKFLEFIFLVNWECVGGSSLSLQISVLQMIFLATNTLRIAMELEASQELE